MKKYLKNTFLFIVISLTLTSVLFFTLRSSVVSRADFRISADTEYAMFGHSHPEHAFNDTLISNFRNFASSGEAYFYTYQKVKQILTQNPQVQTVFIEFSNNQINETKDEWIWADKYITNRYPQFAPFMDNQDNMILLKNNYSGYVNSLSVSLRRNFERVLKQDFSFKDVLGGYVYSKRDKIDSLIVAYREFPDKAEHFSEELSPINLFYLRKCIDLCKENNKKVILVRTPQHPLYAGWEIEDQFQQIVKNDFGDVEFWDFQDFKLDQADFSDLDHLNYQGSTKFSIYFESYLKENR